MPPANRTYDQTNLILDMLTLRGRAAVEQHIAILLGLHNSKTRAMRSRLRRLEEAGLVYRERLVVATVTIDEPIQAWQPGCPEPNHDALAWQLEYRWATAVAAPHTVIWATKKAARLFGGCGGELRQPLQIQHDLGVVATFVRRRELQPTQTARWVSEDVLQRRRLVNPKGKMPDAAILDSAGSIQTLIEFGGKYSADRLRRFYRHCQRQCLPYELW